MESPPLTDEEVARYIPVIDGILNASDLVTISVKKVRNALAQEVGRGFTEQDAKRQIGEIIAARFDLIVANRQPSGASPSPSSPPSAASPASTTGKRPLPTYEDDAKMAAELQAQLNGTGRITRGGRRAPPKVRKKKKKSARQVDSESEGGEESGERSAKKRQPNPNNAFMKPLVLAPVLAEFLGETQMSRPAVVKAIWAYVKEHGLQNPDDKRYILCDDRMKPIFGDKVHMFTMNKVLTKFMFKPEEVAGGQKQGMLLPTPDPEVKREVKAGEYEEVSEEQSDAGSSYV